MELTVSLSTAAAMGMLAIWLMIRVGRVRAQAKIMHGDGGNPVLMRRMRAQMNFVETAPFIFALILLIDMAGKGGQWLPYVAGIYVIGRVLHALGMDSEEVTKLRMAGVTATMLILLGLSVIAVLILMRVM